LAESGCEILRACGAQDDTSRSFWSKEEGRTPSDARLRTGLPRAAPSHRLRLFSTGAARRCHPERARGTRASEGSRVKGEGATQRVRLALDAIAVEEILG